MLKAVHMLCFVHEVTHRARIPDQLWSKKLNRHLSTSGGIAPQEDNPHAASAENAHDFKAFQAPEQPRPSRPVHHATLDHLADGAAKLRNRQFERIRPWVRRIHATQSWPP